jgi:hypothetical protein
VIELEDEEAGVAAVEQAEAIAALLDLQVGPGAAVDEHGIAEELRVPDGRDVAGAGAGRVGMKGMSSTPSPGNCSAGTFSSSKKARLSG